MIVHEVAGRDPAGSCTRAVTVVSEPISSSAEGPIRIAGAGIAGLAAAITLARRGRHVEVLERGTHPSARSSGDFQGLENWTREEDVLTELARLGFPGVAPLARPFHEMEFHGPDGQRVPIRTGRPLFYLVRRGGGPGSLEQYLHEAAEDAGVAIRFGSRVARRSDCDLVATGTKRPDGLVAGYLFRTDAPDLAVGVVDNRLGPWGYAYLLVWNGRGTLGSVVCRNLRRAETYRDRTLEYFRRAVPIPMHDLKPFGGIGNYFRLGRKRLRGVLYAGEAAGFQDALWGFGMRYAFQSGVLAARDLLGEADYDAACRATFGASMRAGVLNRVAWCLGGHVGYRAFLRRLDHDADPWPLFNWAYRMGRARRVLASAAETMLWLRLHVVFCNHIRCECLWCRHGRW